MSAAAENGITAKLKVAAVAYPWQTQLAQTASAEYIKAAQMWRCHGRLVELEEELWAPRTVRLMCGSWNTNGKVLAKDKVREWIRAAEHNWGDDGAQVYVLGLQEAVELDAMNLMSDAGSRAGSSAANAASLYKDAKGKLTPLGAWKQEVEAAVSEVVGKLEFVTVRQLVGVMLFVFVSSDIKPLVGHVSVETVRTGLGGMAGNKGAVSVRMELGYSHVSFICAHLAAHTNQVVARNTNYHTIVQDLPFQGPKYPPKYPHRVSLALKGRRAEVCNV